MYKTVTIFDVREYLEMEGRRMKHVGYFLSQEAAKRAAVGKGPGGHGDITATEIITEGPMKGVRLAAVQGLQRLPIDKMIHEAKIQEDLRSRLTEEEIRILRQ